MQSQKMRNNIWLLVVLLFSACQKIEIFDDTEQQTGQNEDQHPKVVRLLGTGKGTAEMPLSVTDFMNSDVDEPVWVIGYVVGTAPKAMSNALFTPEADNKSNILLSADSLCEDIADCIPVELTSTKMRNNFALGSDSGRFRQCLMLFGSPSVYLRVRGLRNITDGQWLYGLDLSSFAPQEWNVIITH